MFLQIDDAIRRNGDLFEADLSEDFEQQLFYGREIVFAEPVTIHCSYSYDGKVLSVNGTVRTVLKSRCARCDKPFDETFQVPYSERFVNMKFASDYEDEECYIFSGNMIDLKESVLNCIFLSLPIISLCKEDCKGLCPVCGCDLNVETCNCNPDR